MWLRDHLPHAVKGSRSILYGYDTSLLDSESFQVIEDVARAFLNTLATSSLGTSSSRPICILAHSLGGILFKHAIVMMARDDHLYVGLLDRICKIVFFGVPHKGMHISHLLAMVGKNLNRKLVKCLDKANGDLKSLDERFSGICRTHKIRVYSIYETQASKVAQV
jgi:hypothetical protein